MKYFSCWRFGSLFLAVEYGRDHLVNSYMHVKTRRAKKKPTRRAKKEPKRIYLFTCMFK